MTFISRNRSGSAGLRLSSLAGVALFTMTSTAALAQAVVVQGNRRVDAETIRAYATRGGSPEEIRRELLSSGMFSDVSVSRRGRQTVIRVSENTGINQVAFEGNRRLKDEFLTGELQTRSRGPLNESLIAADVEKIRDLYRRAGYGLTSVTYRIVPMPNGRSDVVFTINESGKTGVREINFSGNEAYGSSRLKGLMSTTEMNMLSWLKTSDVYDPDRISSDLELVRRFYLRNGYADFRIVSSNVTFDADKGGYIVDIVVSEGEQYRVGSVDVSSRLRDVDGNELRGVISTREGDVYNAEAVERTLQAMTIEVARRGYAFSQVRPTGERDPASRTVSISYIVDEGPRVYVERINVRGNTRTRDYVIRREFDLGEGDAYNKVLVDRAERRLNNLGFFNRVRITNEPGSAPDRVVVNVDVEDKPTGSFSIAGGYSTTDGFIGDVSLSESNFLGRGQYVRIAGSLGERSRGIEFSFTEPFFLGQRIAAGFDVFSKYSDNSQTARYESRMTGVTLRATFPITEEFSVTPRYSIYEQQIKVPNTASHPYNDCLVGAPGLTDNSVTPIGYPQTVIGGVAYADCVLNGEASVAIKQARGRALTSLAGLTLTYNSLDNAIEPRNGLYVDLRPEVAGLGGDSKFFRFTGDARYFREIYDDIVGIARIQGGYIGGFGSRNGENLNIIDHFFLGPGLVRGFAPSGIGPRDVRAGNAGAVGGTTYFGGSLEVQFPIPFLPREVGMKLAVFADAGTVFGFDSGRAAVGALCPAGTKARFFDLNRNGVQDANFDVPGASEIACIRDNNTLRSSVGASLLWNSPLGPIRFDYAVALSKDKGVIDTVAGSPTFGQRVGADITQSFRFSGGTRF